MQEESFQTDLQEERLQKILARAAVASRRGAEELIRAGRVWVNGRRAELGDRAHARRDAIKVDGKQIRLPHNHYYLLFNKPRDVITSRSDPEGRSTVLDFVPRALRRMVFPVGRLDYQSEGLLILTSDGELAQRVAHPRYGCAKTYEVKVKGQPSQAAVVRLRTGVVVAGRRTAPCKVRRHRRVSRSGRGSSTNSWWIVELREGRSRQIREMFFRVGHPVQRLRRVSIGPLADRHLAPGDCRPLTAQEVEMLRTTAGSSGVSSKKKTKRAARTREGRKSQGSPAAAPGTTPATQDGASALVVAIDGPSGVGKSTAARGLAGRLGIPYLDTGAMYRAVGLKVLKTGIDPGDPAAVEQVLAELDLDLRVRGGGVDILLDGERVEDKIRSPEVGGITSQVATHTQVRKKLVALQRRIARKAGAVLEGRDIGTVVFPHAAHKFFFEAPDAVRIERRFQQLRGQGKEVSRQEVADEIASRDRRDQDREASPLTKDPSYVVVDTSQLSPQDVVEEMMRRIRDRAG